jgi:hypothetical protein
MLVSLGKILIKNVPESYEHLRILHQAHLEDGKWIS